MSNFRQELEQLLGRYSKENGSDTPDFILANFLANVLMELDGAVNARARWYAKASPAPQPERPPEQSP